MEFRDAVRSLRKELGMTQTDLAQALHVNYATVSRWEGGKTSPNRSLSAVLMEYAYAQNASEECCENLKQAISDATKDRLSPDSGELYTVEHATLSHLVEDASFPIYVCDLETDELLYMNRQTEKITNSSLKDNPGVKCYERMMHRDSPCPFCHKEELCDDFFKGFDAFRPADNTYHRVQGKLLRWNGRRAQIRYITDVGGTVNASAQKEREAAYHEIIKLRRQFAGDALACAHYNLTKNTVSDIECENPEWVKILSTEDIDKTISRVSGNVISDEERRHFESIQTREAMIRSFYHGKTHIAIKHFIKSMRGSFETTIDLIQNPVTYDIEAFATVRDTSEDTIAKRIIDTLYGTDYETIATIDADTGEARPYLGRHIQSVISEQKAVGGFAEGVESYLRKHCVDDDVDRVIRETSIPFVKERLEKQKTHAVTYSLKDGGRIVHKRVMFAYLDSTRRSLLCTMQDITPTFRSTALRHERLAEAVKTLCELSGMNIARYDLKTKTYYNDCSSLDTLGYGEIVENVPDAFINDGNVSPESVRSFREFFEKLRHGETASASPVLRGQNGDFHLFKINGRVIFDEKMKPCQAVIVLRDVDEMRSQSPVYKKLKKLALRREEKDYAIFRSNLSRGGCNYAVEGGLLHADPANGAATLDDKTERFAACLHEDDAQAYRELVNTENLLRAFKLGQTAASMSYRVRQEDGDFKWENLYLEMVQFPDCEDIEVIMLFQKED